MRSHDARAASQSARQRDLRPRMRRPALRRHGVALRRRSAGRNLRHQQQGRQRGGHGGKRRSDHMQPRPTTRRGPRHIAQGTLPRQDRQGEQPAGHRARQDRGGRAVKEPTPRHQALVDAWRDVATAGDVDDKREAYQAAMLAIFRPGGPVDEGEIDKAEATDEAVELGEAHDGLFRDREELEHLIRQASLGWRALAPCRPREPGEWAPNSLWNPANIKVAAPAIRATPYQWRELQEIRRRAWLYGRHYIRGFLSTTIGRPGLGKTDLAIVESIDMAAARKILDHQDRDPLRVWYLGEDPR